jgi:hypothetical protein
MARNTLTSESRIAGFVAKYTPEIAQQIIAARAKMRAHFPRGYELVFDNYNALVFGFSPSEKASESFISIAAYPRWITLFFLNGVTLRDPERLLQGSGSRVRGVRLRSAEDLDDGSIGALIAQARVPVAKAMDEAPPLGTVIKLVSAKQRPRRPVAAIRKMRAPGR